MNKTDLLKQIAKAIAKSAKTVDPKVKVVGAKLTAGLGAAKLADDLILDKVPGIKNAMVWTDEKITQGQQWLVDNTLGRIPGVGPIISKMHKKGTEIRYKIRDALFGSNHPDWYEHLPQHVPFTIPGSYNNKLVKFEISSGNSTTIPSVATINLVRNVITTSYATTSRYSEIYTAVKYARGLSYLPYDVNQLALMFEIGNELAVLYYRITKAVSAAFHFSLTKANLPNAIFSGLKFTDIVDEYANYVTLLDQMYNFMSVNVPLLPMIHNKLRQMCLFTALDSEKPAMSTYIQAVVYNNTLITTNDGKKFYSSGVDIPVNIQGCRHLFEYYMNMLTKGSGTTSELLNVIADVKGSIASVAYVGNWRDIKFDDTIVNDELFLNSIKNMDLLPTFGIVCEQSGTNFGYVCNNFVNASQGNYSNPIDIASGNPVDVDIRMGSSNNPQDASETPKYVCCSGSKLVKAFAKSVFQLTTPYQYDLTDPEYVKDNRLVSLQGNENTEGSILETLSLGLNIKKASVEQPSGKTPCYCNITASSGLFVGLFIDVSNGYDTAETKAIRNELAIPGWTDSTEIAAMPTTWSLVDWMPYVVCTIFYSANTYFTTHLWDINGIGHLSNQAMDTALDYITYSLLYPGDVEALNKVELANKLISTLKSK